MEVLSSRKKALRLIHKLNQGKVITPTIKRHDHDLEFQYCKDCNKIHTIEPIDYINGLPVYLDKYPSNTKHTKITITYDDGSVETRELID